MNNGTANGDESPLHEHKGDLEGEFTKKGRELVNARGDEWCGIQQFTARKGRRHP